MKTYITTNLVYRMSYFVYRNTRCVQHAKKRYGFTILEMLLVVAVVALVAGLGGGVYVGTYKRMLVEKAARDMVLTAKYARIMAVEKQQPYEMRLDVTNNGVSLVTNQWDEQSEQTEQTVVRDLYCRPVEFGNGVVFEDIQIVPVDTDVAASTYEGQGIIFSPKGTAQSALVQVGDGRNHYTVCVSAATGRTKMFYDTADNVTIKTIDLDAE